MDEVQGQITAASESAWKSGQIYSYAHQVVHQLRCAELRALLAQRAASAAQEIEDGYFKQLHRGEEAKKKRLALILPEDVTAAAAAGGVSDNVAFLSWLLRSSVTDATTPAVLKVCRKWGITSVSLPARQAEGAAVEAAPPLGELVDQQWRLQVVEEPMVGRMVEIATQRAHLGAAIKGGKHFCIEGAPGVGKTTFVRRLIADCAKAWGQSPDPVLPRLQFLYVPTTAFAATAEQNKATLTLLFDYLAKNRHVVLVLDGYESVVGSSALAKDFEDIFGAVLRLRGRSMILVRNSHSGGGDAQVFSSNAVFKLGPIEAEEAQHIVAQTIEEMAQRARKKSDFQLANVAADIVRYAADYYPGRYQPEIGIHIARGGIMRAMNGNAKVINAKDFWHFICEEQHLGAGRSADECTFLDEVGKTLKAQMVIGQDHAVDAVVDFFKMRTQMTPRRAPRGIFLFAGPPGIGKTELGRGLAATLGFDPDEDFHVFNMSEYSGDGARTRFMGADPGYKGFESTRTIYDACRANKPCVILLDEVDRASATLQDILLSIFEGQGKDSRGQTVYFSNAIFILTTNRQQETIEKEYFVACPVPAEKDLRASIMMELAKPSNDTGNRYAFARGKWPSRRLKELLTSGVMSSQEGAMRQWLEEQATEAAQLFEEQRDGKLLDRYLALQSRLKEFDYAGRHSVMDRAFLSRIDRFIPFFPIRELSLVCRLVKHFVHAEGWQWCTPEMMAEVAAEFVAQPGSVRDLKVLIGLNMQDSLQRGTPRRVPAEKGLSSPRTNS